MVYMAPTTIYAISGGRSRRVASPGRRGSRIRGGLTLVEMLVVVGVIVLLAGAVVTVTRHVDNQSKTRALKGEFGLLKSALREYHDFNDVFPVQTEVIPANALAHSRFLYTQLDLAPVSRQVLRQIDPSLIQGSAGTADSYRVVDPWGTPIDYRYKDGDAFPVLISAGPDKTWGTGDDISSRDM
jgi:general secretion pathway protein G